MDEELTDEDFKKAIAECPYKQKANDIDFCLCSCFFCITTIEDGACVSIGDMIKKKMEEVKNDT